MCLPLAIDHCQMENHYGDQIQDGGGEVLHEIDIIQDSSQLGVV